MSIAARLSAFAEHVWESDAVGAALLRGVLTPSEWIYASVVAHRNRAYDAVTASAPVLAALSVGNLTVGGTGKTPVAAWCVRELARRGASPAVVMRGYGDDEWRVHALLNPGVPVVVAADRRAGLVTARVRGADCAVLDDAFQHRRVARAADLVLISADRWHERARMLPAGPYREPFTALRRADVAVITVKAASAERVAAAQLAIAQAAPHVPIAIARVVPGSLRLAVSLPQGDPSMRARGGSQSLTHAAEWLAGREVTVVSAIGDPAAFEAQIRALGAVVRRAHRFADHHAYTVADAEALALAGEDVAGVICTLKDAVKLSSLWPREAPPLWYVSQTVVVERGAEALDRAFARVLAARAGTAPTAG